MVDSGLIGKIEKAKRYSEERERIKVDSLTVTFNGENITHHTSFDGTHWHCDCDYFHTHHLCSHSMALQRILEKMVPDSVHDIY